ncbi:hypothetical protein P7C73_g4439, partial [Tremellales sp. Uapishka_1]
MTSPSLASISSKTTTTSSLLLERSRVLSLNLPPSASSQNQIIRNLTSIKNDLAQLSIERSGLSVGGGSGGKSSKLNDRELKGLEAGYDRLLDMFAEDQFGRDKVKSLRREVVKLPSPEPITPVIPPSSPTFIVEPPTPAAPAAPMPFRDYPEDETDDQPSAHRDILDQQQIMMEGRQYASPSGTCQLNESIPLDQDERLNLLSHSIGRQNHLSVQIGSELDLHHQLLEDTDEAIDRTSDRLRKARRRLDKVAEDAKQYGSTITIVVLIFVLLILIIVFKT